MASQPASTDENTPLYYVDGQIVAQKSITEQTYRDIATLKLLKDAQVQQVLGNAVTASRATVITTKANQQRTNVVAFNRKVDAAGAQDTHIKIGPKVDPATHQLPDGIKAYIAKTYPGSTIGGYFVSDHARPKPPYVQYYASITASNGEKHKLYFNSAEQLVAMPAATADQSASRTPGLGNGKPAPVVYLDGQRYRGNINDIGPESIANISVFKGEQARQLAGAEGAGGIIVVTTKQNQDQPEVRAFNEKMNAKGVPAAAAPGTPYLAAPALAYITKNYPDARLLGVTEVPAADGGAPRYQAQVAIGRRPGYLLFDGAGQFISESYTSYLK